MASKTTDWSRIAIDSAAKAHAVEIAAMEKKVEERQRFAEECAKQRDIALAIDRRPKVRPILAKEDAASEAVAVVLASDWHYEETVDPTSVSGLNEFNLEIADKRIEKFAQSVVRLTDIQRGGTDINTLVLAMLGDFITGYIHEELVESNSLSPTQAIERISGKIASVISHFKKNFKRVIIPCSYGNHGRTTKKPRASTGAANSYEWLMYRLLSKYVDGVEWHVADGYHNYLNIYDWTTRFHHGDGLTYNGGIGGLTIPVEKAIAAWNKGIVAHLDCFGHWHTSQQNPKWLCNGSLIGYSAYALQIKAPFEPPSQTFFLMDPKRGRTVTAPIFLT